MRTLPAAGPVIFRATNASSHGNQHSLDIVTPPDGTTSQQVIAGEVDPRDVVTGFVGALSLEAGETGDLAVESLTPGWYLLICPLETADGTRLRRSVEGTG